MAVSRIQLAPEGPACSRFVAGFWRLSDWDMTPRERLSFIQMCLDLGVTTMDHADIYGDYACEGMFGEALALDPSLRDRMELVSKCGIQLVSPARPETGVKHYDTGRDYIVASAERSLRKLATDRLDVLLIHRPDPLMDADEIAEAFTGLRRDGKVLHFGVSNFTPSQFQLLASRLDFPLVTNQVEISPLQLAPLHDGTLDLCQQLRIRPMAWSCLGGGRLMVDHDDQARQVRLVLHEIGEELGGVGMDQVAYAWVLRHPSQPLPIVGTGKLARLQSAVESGEVALTRQQWFRIWEASAGQPVP